MKLAKGQKVRWVGPPCPVRGERGIGVVTYETWENGCYVKWPDGFEEPCHHFNLEAHNEEDTKGKTLVEVFEEEERSLSPPMKGALVYMFTLEAECKDTGMCPNIAKSQSTSIRLGGPSGLRLHVLDIRPRFRRYASSTLRALVRRRLIEETICKLDYETKEYRLTDAGRSVAEGLKR